MPAQRRRRRRRAPVASIGSSLGRISRQEMIVLPSPPSDRSASSTNSLSSPLPSLFESEKLLAGRGAPQPGVR